MPSHSCPIISVRACLTESIIWHGQGTVADGVWCGNISFVFSLSCSPFYAGNKQVILLLRTSERIAAVLKETCNSAQILDNNKRRERLVHRPRYAKAKKSFVYFPNFLFFPRASINLTQFSAYTTCFHNVLFIVIIVIIMML